MQCVGNTGPPENVQPNVAVARSDQVHCDLEIAREKSPWLCYFPGAEFLCGIDENDIGSDGNLIQQQLNVSDPRDKKHQCSLKKQPGFLEPFAPTLRNKLVIQEAQCQME